MKKFVLGIPNGSLFKRTSELLGKIGIRVLVNGRNFEAGIEGSDIFKRAYIMRPQKIPNAIAKGAVDCGICGWDCVIESRLEAKLRKVMELSYSKTTGKPVRIIVFGKKKKFIDEKHISVSSEYINITRSVFKKARIDFSYGSTEVDVLTGMYDYGICVTETGRSLEDNGLKIVRIILSSSTVLMAKEDHPAIRFFGQLLLGALDAERYQLIKMDVSRRIKERVLSILPAVQSPTVSKLADDSFAVETAVLKSETADLIIKLQKLGVRGIIAQDINIIIL
ncbi:ATP phosphoribosyltransferase [Patescibacteria group bacterium]|nr:ATP phosphoribosyltransferase [Patescibacteria group bacterium]MBU4347192.1 ATP phosphoribosyltransferase [Patescibacteria group bacterium]MBU4455230.1 ATP phosphoribosyltransferase [Patescibacteria group bacterium]MCG2691005.1 ATP phosphoribosyltransferase [Candidatus Parcubacteria bacterium]